MREGVKRIRDISTSLRTFSRADSDRPVACNIHDGIDSTILILKHRLEASETRPEIHVVKQLQISGNTKSESFKDLAAWLALLSVFPDIK
ncbi:MAG: hypothetical protein ACYTXY_03670 [Nostoc sp.]